MIYIVHICICTIWQTRKRKKPASGNGNKQHFLMDVSLIQLQAQHCAPGKPLAWQLQLDSRGGCKITVKAVAF